MGIGILGGVFRITDSRIDKPQWRECGRGHLETPRAELKLRVVVAARTQMRSPVRRVRVEIIDRDDVLRDLGYSKLVGRAIYAPGRDGIVGSALHQLSRARREW